MFFLYSIHDQGKEYLDFFAGVSVMNCGHCNLEILEKTIQQMQTLQHTTIIYLTEEERNEYLKISKQELNKNKITVMKQNKDKKVKNMIIVVFSIALVIGCITIISLILYKKYKNNRLEY